MHTNAAHGSRAILGAIALLASQCGGSARSTESPGGQTAGGVAPAPRGPSAAPTTSASPAPPIESGARLSSRAIALPGGPPVWMDFLAYDPATHSVWIPAGNTARVDVLDTSNDAIRSVDGFATAEREGPRGRRVVGPSSVAIGEGMAFVGNRANAEICAVDAHTLRRGECVTLSSPPDALTVVPSAHQLWATTPHEHSITVVRVNGAHRPAIEATVPVEGEPEGNALDPNAMVFYTNLEDRDRTLAIDVRTRRVVHDWSPGCGAEGPRGLAIDVARQQLFVACTDRVVALDLAHDGAVLGSAATGGGVDLIDYLSARHLLYVGSARTATLRVVSVDERGTMRVVASAPTAQGARNAVVDENGRAYLADALGGRIFVSEPPP